MIYNLSLSTLLLYLTLGISYLNSQLQYIQCTVCYGQLPVTCTVHCTIPKKKKHQDLQYKKRGNSIGKAQRR